MPPSLSVTAALILHEVAAGTRYGFDVMERTGLPSGTVYPALRRLEKHGLVRGDWEAAAAAHAAGRPRRRYYRVTAAGVESLESARRRYAVLRDTGRDAAGSAAEPETP